MELGIIAVIPLIPNLINSYTLMEVDIMDIIKTIIVEIIVEIIFGGINGPLAVERA